jgi:hypothetical protein
VSRVLHLSRRFVASLRPGGPGPTDEAWARDHLSPDERRLWDRMSGPDRRHAVDVARDVEAELGAAVTPTVVTAALLHDVGKTVAGLGTYGRVVATLSAAVAGEDTARLWARGRGITRRVGLYVDYPTLGVDLLKLAGSDPLVVAWSLEHHLPPEQWTVDPEIGAALAAADERA